MTEVVLVNEMDEAIGTMEKMEAHQKGKLHRAFSIFIYNGRGEILLQQRSLSKYHNGGLWTNACCSHPYPGERVEQAALRRLKEELGFTTLLTKIFNFTYRADFSNGLTEHEFDHVFYGIYNGELHADSSEVMNTRFISPPDLKLSIEQNPAMYTPWFKIALPKMEIYQTVASNQ